MADKTINDLTAATALADGDLGEIENTGNNSRKYALTLLRNYVQTFSPVVGALVHKAADETTANYSTTTAIPWDSEASGYDTDGFHDNSSSNTRLTVPDLTATYGRKAKKVSLRGYVSLNLVTANEPISLVINKNGAAAMGLPFINHGSPATGVGIEAVAFNIPVTGAGTEYFELLLDAGADASITIASNRSCFQIWVTEWQA